MKQTQKLVSLVLAVVMILSCFACGVFAAEGSKVLGDVNRDGVMDITDATDVQL